MCVTFDNAIEILLRFEKVLIRNKFVSSSDDTYLKQLSFHNVS
jgi:hypothetical protein